LLQCARKRLFLIHLGILLLLFYSYISCRIAASIILYSVHFRKTGCLFVKDIVP